MKRFWRKNWCWICGGMLVLGLGWALQHFTAQARIESGPVGNLSLQEVLMLKEYHGARVARLEHGHWYFLGPRGRRWYSLTTPAACRDLNLVCTRTAAK
ncbi:hypothetical protein [Thermosulfurimonas sp.]|uniref:hypothetical protein n=1 Tax=Thermosulfurimonas sp. TaxID=2080236 RepID=UPI0025D7C5FE|nr:hypothetical protein [Thermosulfurimonas sp.]